ncbi:LysR substrate-binding domain-containing protein [Marinoscillum furvescens]|uniref:LysR family transcriptional regulator n=1 Tax=Marinoscillum furvescens DSM 4134 TaxID=1122208 RepID=A0A3D9KZF3_MARFU|nr:LysR substrate-binding domain-containing protein [Marinoscillum furvescens]RED92288.1 LysR family transcriptional regulator [Marinoscillum furvescens DSM 4134]
MDLEIRHLKLIKAIANAGNLAGAANDLHLTPSAVSHQLRALENQLGVAVFDRQQKPWELTPAGTQLFQLSLSVLGAVSSRLRQVQNLKPNKNLRVGSECYAFYLLLQRYHFTLEADYAPIAPELIHQRLMHHELDLGMTTIAPKSEKLTSCTLKQDEIRVIVPDDHPLAEASFVPAEAFQQEVLLIHSYPLETVYVYQHFLLPNGVEPAAILPIPLTEVALQMVAEGKGLLCLPDWQLDRFTLPKGLTTQTIGAQGLHRTVHAVYRNEDQNLPQLKQLTDEVLTLKTW